MNALILSVLSLVSAVRVMSIPIFINSSKVSFPTNDGMSTIQFDKHSLYANITIDDIPFTTHIEPKNSDFWVYGTLEDDGPDFKYNAKQKHAVSPFTDNSHEGSYYVGKIECGDFHVRAMDFGVDFKEVARGEPTVGGFGLSHSNTSSSITQSPDGKPVFHHSTFTDIAEIFGIATSNVFSIVIDETDTARGFVQYGAVDTSRFTGNMKAVWRNPEYPYFYPKFLVNGIKTQATFDIEDPNTYLEDDVADKLAQSYGAAWDENRGLFKTSVKPEKDLVLDFEGVKISVPASELWKQDTSVDKDNWYFTIRPLTSALLYNHTPTLGADIMNSIYVVYDPAHGRVAFSQMVHTSRPPNYDYLHSDGLERIYVY